MAKMAWKTVRIRTIEPRKLEAEIQFLEADSSAGAIIQCTFDSRFLRPLVTAASGGHRTRVKLLGTGKLKPKRITCLTFEKESNK